MWKPSDHEQKHRCHHKARERAFHMNPQSTASAPTLSLHRGPTMTAHVAARCSVLCNQARNEPFISVLLSLCPPLLSWRHIRISKNASSYFPLLLFSTSVYKSNSFWKITKTKNKSTTILSENTSFKQTLYQNGNCLMTLSRIWTILRPHIIFII